MRSLSADDPRVIGPYRLSALLGAGGMGRVYLGTGPDGDTAAVKVVRAEYAYDPGFRGRFALELDLAGRVHGDFTPRVLDADPTGTPPWMATEYVSGPTLHDLVRRTGPLPEESVRFLARGMAIALARVHARGTVHHDLKPGNVMVSASGPQVIDFGVARALEEGEDSEETLVSGTPGYMAPEQATGGKVTSASDVFALGGVLAYALTGTGPYGDGHPAAVVFRIANREPVLDGIPEGLRSVVTACLSRDPEARPTAAWVLEELGGPVSPATNAEDWLPEMAAQRVKRVTEETAGFLSPNRSQALADHSDGPGKGAVWLTRRWPLAAGAGATALALFAGLAVWAVVERDGSTERSDQESRTIGCDLPEDLPPEYVEAARTDATVPGADNLHLDGHVYPTLTFLEGGDLLAVAHPEGIALWDTETGEEVAYVGADLPDFSGTPVVSPDGCRFGYTPLVLGNSNGPELGAYVFDLRTGEHTVHAQEWMLKALAFAPDGQSFTIGEMEGVYEIDLESGEVGTVIMEDYSEIAYSPSGDHLGVISVSSVAVMDTRTGDRVFVEGEAETGTNMPAMVLPNDDGDLLYIREEGIFQANFLTDSEPRLFASNEDVPYGFNAVFASSETNRLFALYHVDDDDGGDSKKIAAWEYSSGERLPIDGGSQNVRSMAVHPTGEVIAGLSQDGRSIRLLDPDTFEVVAEFG